MFKWSCLAVATAFGLVLLWMVNDLRREAQQVVRTVRNDLPEIVSRSREVAETVHGHLPQLLERTGKTTETVAALSEDLQQIREVAGLVGGSRERNLAGYTADLLKFIANSGGRIGLRSVTGRGLSDPVPAREWVSGRRREALLDVLFLASSRAEVLDGLCGRTLGRDWSIQFEGQPPQYLRDWVLANHPPSKDLKGAAAPGNGPPKK